jgi:hypothetical protein
MFHSPIPVQSAPPKNHKSWTEAFPLLIRDIAKGQARGEYLLLEGDLLPMLMQSKQIFLSPFGGAPKDGKPLTESARIVHDESFPRNHGTSINSATTNIPLEIHHDGVKQIARWGLDEAARYPDDVVMMTGDVSGAFRHIPINCWFCGRFSGYVPELNLIVVNLSLPFGWTGSPVTYSIAGQAIKAIHFNGIATDHSIKPTTAAAAASGSAVFTAAIAEVIRQAPLQFRWERALTNPCGVSLGNPNYAIDQGGPHSSANTGAPSHRI